MMTAMTKLIILIIFNILLVSCSKNKDIKAFIEQTKKTQHANLPPLAALKEYAQLDYQVAKLRDPFSLPASNISLKIPIAEHKVKPLRPDHDRTKEFLETIPLDSLTMVGTIKKQGEIWALIVDRSGVVYKVKKGNYLGENSGKINKITEDSIYMNEIVSDEHGNWINRDVTLGISVK